MIYSKDEKKQKLLSVALELFWKNGMSKTTIAQITDVANIGKSTFYEYFKSKEDLLNQWFESFIMQLAGIGGFLETIPLNKDKIFALVQGSCGKEFTNEGFITVFVEFWRLAFSEKNEKSLELINIFYASFKEQLKVYINEGIKNKEFKQCDVDKVATNIMAMIDGQWIQYMLDNDYDLENNALYSMELFLKGISYD
jgi:hypothetical protein